MLTKYRIGLNRIAYPGVGIGDFFSITAELGLHKVELRNDLPGNKIIDGLPPVQIRELAQSCGIEILSINALQKFNVPEKLQSASRELKSMTELARSIGCPAIVLCPNNDRGDTRAREQSLRDTVAALKAFCPQFEDSGLLGYMEPLGFPESSLDSLFTAARAIEETGRRCYKVVYDTFHHYLGPDGGEAVETKFDVSLIGLVHASGVEEDVERTEMKDEHRLFITAADRIGNLEQIARLLALGYEGDVSLEPFSARVQRLEVNDFLEAAKQCIERLAR